MGERSGSASVWDREKRRAPRWGSPSIFKPRSDRPQIIAMRRKPAQRRQSSYLTADEDNETLDHLLSLSCRAAKVGGNRPDRKAGAAWELSRLPCPLRAPAILHLIRLPVSVIGRKGYRDTSTAVFDVRIWCDRNLAVELHG